MPFSRKGKVQGSKARVLTAAGQVITPSGTEKARALANARQPWQEDAWAYRELIPELRFGTQFLAHAVSQATYFPAQVNHDGGDPIPLDSKECTLSDKAKKVAQEEHERLPFHSGMSFTGRAIENLQLPAECYLHSFEENGLEQWRIRSMDEISLNGDGLTGRVQEGDGQSREFSLSQEDVVRLWYPHPKRWWEPDSPMRGLLDVCEDIVLAGKEQRAAARSRIAANGLLLVPSGMVMLGGTDADGNPVRRDTADSRFLNDFLAQFMAPIRNEGDPGSVAPVMLVGDAQDIDKIKHLTFVRETSGDLGDKIERGIRRLSTGLDMPGELITGMSDANHWTAWQIDSATARYHVAPWCLVWCDSLTLGFQRPAVQARGIDQDEAQQLQYHYDLGAITENPNRRDDAKDAWDRGLISNEAARNDLGYDEGDRPNDKELIQRIAWKIGVTPDLAARMLEVVLGKSSGMKEVIDLDIAQPMPDEQPTAGPQQPGDGSAPAQLPPGNGGNGTPGPGSGTPNGQDAQPQAPANGQAGHAGYNVSRAGDPAFATAGDVHPTGWGMDVDIDACRELSTIERSLRERLMQAGDDAIERAVERAGNRLRTQARKTPSLASLLDGVPATEVGHVLASLDREALAGLDMQTDALLEESFDQLRPRFVRWAGAAIDQVIAATKRILGVRSSQAAERARERMHANLGDGWDTYRQHLQTRAQARLWRPDRLDVPPVGEQPDTITSPEGVRKALSVVGGEDDRQAGIAAGQVVTSLMRDEGAAELGYEWAYGVLPRRPFEPHQRLHGRRFANWTDPILSTLGTKGEFVGPYFHPGDHTGCMCDYTYLWALAVLGPRADAQAEQERVTAPQENEAQRNHRLLLESDRAAGRTNTTVVATERERQAILARARQTYRIEESA